MPGLDSWYARRGKRLVDLTIGVVAVVVLSPVLLLTAAAVAVALGRPVLFRQTRPGRNARPFTMLKFRTMRNASAIGDDSDAARLTRFGRFLRSTSLDELPELWNVVAGDMSLIGPRPLLMDYLPLYSETERHRHDVRPGITGLAQINGRNALSWPERFKLDVRYVENVSPRVDFGILTLTVVRVLERSGIAQESHATAERFTGSHNH